MEYSLEVYRMNHMLWPSSVPWPPVYLPLLVILHAIPVIGPPDCYNMYKFIFWVLQEKPQALVSQSLLTLTYITKRLPHLGILSYNKNQPKSDR